MNTYYLLFESHYWTFGENSSDAHKTFLDCYDKKYDAQFEVSDRLTQHAADIGLLRIESTSDDAAIYYKDGEVIEWNIIEINNKTDHDATIFDIYLIHRRDHEEDNITECFDYAMEHNHDDGNEVTSQYMADISEYYSQGWEHFLHSGVFHDACGELVYCNDEFALTCIEY